MVVKAIVLISAHFSLYGLMISGFFEPYWAYLLMYVGLGVGMTMDVSRP